MPMQRIIGIATGCFWRFERGHNRDALIKYVAITGGEGIELTFYGRSSLRKFVLSDSSKEIIKKSKFVSIHAPDLRRIKSNQQEMFKVLYELEELYYSIDADYIVFHPDSIKDFNVLKQFSFNTALENLDKNNHIPPNAFLKVLCDNQDLSFCLDVAHAYSWSDAVASFFVDELEPRISHIHLSCSDGERSHLPFKESPPDFIKSLRIIERLQVPIIIEEDIPAANISSIIADLTIVKRMFSTEVPKV